MAALGHRQPDKTPIDLGGHRSSGIAAIAYARLRKALGLARRPIRVYDPLQQLAIIDDDVLDRFQVDTIELGRGFAVEDRHWADWTLPDGTPCQMPAWAMPQREANQWVLRSPNGRTLARMPNGAIYFEQCYWPYLDHDDLDRLPEALTENMWSGVRSPPGPLCAGPDGDRVLADGARRLRAQTDRAIIGLFGGNLLETGQFLYRNDNFFMLLAGNPRRAHKFLDRLVEIHLTNLERFLGAVGPHIDVILFGDDLGMQNGPQISPAMYREFFKPRHALMWRTGEGTGPSEGPAALLRRRSTLVRQPDRGGARCDQSGPGHLRRHGDGGPEAGFRRPAHLLGRRLRNRLDPLSRHPRTKSAVTSANKFRSSRPAAALSSSRSTTSWPTSRRRTLSPCSTRSTSRRRVPSPSGRGQGASPLPPGEGRVRA